VERPKKIENLQVAMGLQDEDDNLALLLFVGLGLQCWQRIWVL
jgi:hypothetical protein